MMLQSQPLETRSDDLKIANLVGVFRVFIAFECRPNPLSERGRFGSMLGQQDRSEKA